MTVMDYRTRDGLANYGFSIDFELARGWRAYITFQPFHQDRNDGLSLPYQAIDGNGRRYVDWPEKLDSLGDAKRLPDSGPRRPSVTIAPKNKDRSMSN
jgi:hypothetical protein